jgi:hypothetical protein
MRKGRRGGWEDEWALRIAWGLLIIVLIYVLWMILQSWLNQRGMQDIGRAGDIVIKPFIGGALVPLAMGKKKRRSSSEMSVPFWVIFAFIVFLVILVALKYIGTYLTKIPDLIGSYSSRVKLI